MLSRADRIILGLALLAAAAGGWLQYQNRHAHPTANVTMVHVGDLRPDLSLTGLDGKPHRLSEFHGRRVLINFWASWCVPCAAELPALSAAQRKFADQDVKVLGIAMDEPAHVEAFLRTHPVAYPVLLGELDEPSTSLQLGDADEVLPYSVLLDEQGRILAMRRGSLAASTLQTWLATPQP